MKEKIQRVVLHYLVFIGTLLGTGLSIVKIVDASKIEFAGAGVFGTIFVSLIAGVLGVVITGMITEQRD